MVAKPNTRCAIRPAEPSDIALILHFVRALAEFERLADYVVADGETLAKNLFGPRPYAECILAFVDGIAAGFALYFHNFSTFTGTPGLYLEDIFVDPQYRGSGVGVALFRELSKIALERDCSRLQWAVLDWNEGAIGFYRSLGAEAMPDWIINRLGRAEMEALAKD